MRAPNAERWQVIEPALEVLLTAAPERRPELLASYERADPDLGRELASLMRAHAAAGTFLEVPAAALVAAEPERDQGQLIGHYRLLERIGKGGMGTVWLAERADHQFDHRVAIKLIKRGMDTEEIHARFLRERQILARLEHPGIARLLDGGVTDDDQPYFVMEYVAGLPITAYCSDASAPIEDRLVLFEQVCHAVHYAHRNLIVHRDLKPSNVIVTAEGLPKLLDFGIAKVLDDHSSETLAGWSRPYTPEYAAPEQVVDGTISTATDVYQLGVLLFELLTGRLPFDLKRRDPAEIRRIVCDEPPPRPSAIDASRRIDPDLDAVVLMALRKEPERRYSSAAALASDLERYRQGIGVLARGDSLGLRASRFAKRHRYRLAGAGALLVASIIAGAAYTIRVQRERDVALQQAAKAAQSEAFIRRFFGSWNPDIADRAVTSVTSHLASVRRRVEVELAGNPQMRAAMLSVLGELYTTISQYERADTLLRAAIATQRGAGRSSFPDLAATLLRRGTLFAGLGRYSDAEGALREALRINESVFGDHHAESLRARLELARTLGIADRWREAEVEFRRIVAAAAADRSTPAEVRGEAEWGVGYSRYQQGDLEEAERLLTASLESHRAEVGELDPATLLIARGLASVKRDKGLLLPADSLYRTVQTALRALYGPDHRESLSAELVLLQNQQRIEVSEDVVKRTRDALARSERALGGDHFVSWQLRLLLGSLLLDEGRYDDAERELRPTLAIVRRLNPNGHQEEGDVVNRLTYLTTRRGSADAQDVYADARRVYLRSGIAAPVFVTDGLHYLAAAMRLHGDTADARRAYERALALYRRSLPPRHRYTLFVERALRGAVP